MMSVKELYNEEYKLAFLNETYKNEKTRNQYKLIFKGTSSNEHIFESDIYDFDLTQIEDTIYGLNLKRASARQAITVLRRYVDWAIKNRLTKKNTNRLREIDGSEYLQGLYDNSKELLLHVDEVTRVEDEVLNSFRESLISRLIFEGAWGVGGAELLNLENNSNYIDEKENTLKLVNNDGSERFIKVSDRLLGLIEKADREELYVPNEGREVKLHKIDNKLIKSRRQTIPKTTSTFLTFSITEAYKEEGYKHYSRQTLRLSGMLHLAKELYEQDGELGNKQWEVIKDQFGLNLESGFTNGRVSDFKEIITLDRINEIYG